MGRRKALLIGVEEYGHDLVRLPSVHQDVALVGDALKFCGYEVEDVSSCNGDASSLLDTLRSFCEECEEGDTHLIYFSGHGTSVEGRDFVIPAGVGRKDADENENKRIQTNLSNFVRSGLVVFVIDACRDTVTTKSANPFGYEKRAGNPNFVRFFGCSQGEVCQVVPEGHKGHDISMFSKAFADTLLEGKSDNLRETLDRATELCQVLVDNNLRLQKPHMDYGETTADTQAMLEKHIFSPPVVSHLWEHFDPNRMHCILLTSEYETETSPEWPLEQMVSLAMKGLHGRNVWKAFREYANQRILLNDNQRILPKEFQAIRLTTYAIKDAFDDGVFDDVVRGLVEADLAIFDVTHFEPGMMLLMGIRSATRRGVSICTHGAGWHELDEIDTPFNLRDLSLGSHTKNPGGKGGDPVIKDFVSRIKLGFGQLATQPTYQDLPAYDALRQLGSQREAASIIPASERILVLASYGNKYNSNWQYLQNTLGGILTDDLAQTKVLRLIDAGNPQLVSQSLYEQIRRTAGCVVDWTEYSPSTFFELGVRLAVSEWGAIQFMDERYLPGGKNAGEWKKMYRQIKRMVDLFEPLVYEVDGDEEPFEKAAKLLKKRNPKSDRLLDPPPDYARVNRIVSDVIKDVEEIHMPVFDMLKNIADTLHHPDEGQKGAPEILFRYGSDSSEQLIKRESERAAREARIAAWLYLHYRMLAGESKPGDQLRVLYEDLGQGAANALFDDGEDSAIDLGEKILQHIEAEGE